MADVANATDRRGNSCYDMLKGGDRMAAWIGLGLFLVIVAAGAWFWGKFNDPRTGAVGCCHCGKCLVAGECVLRRELQKTAEKK